MKLPSSESLIWRVILGLCAVAAVFLLVEHQGRSATAPGVISFRSVDVVAVVSAERPSRPIAMSQEAGTVPVAVEGGDADPFTAIHLKLALWLQTDPHDRASCDRLQNDLAKMLIGVRPDEVLKKLSSEELDTPFGMRAFNRWLEADPAAAARWAAEGLDRTRDQAWAVAHTLLEDPAAYKSFCDGLPESDWKQAFLADSVTAIVSIDPVAAIDLCRRMRPNEIRNGLLQDVAVNWMAADPDSAGRWIMGEADQQLRESLIKSVSDVYLATP